jgi:hypothetical protein
LCQRENIAYSTLAQLRGGAFPPARRAKKRRKKIAAVKSVFKRSGTGSRQENA